MKPFNLDSFRNGAIARDRLGNRYEWVEGVGELAPVRARCIDISYPAAVGIVFTYYECGSYCMEAGESVYDLIELEEPNETV